MCTQQERKKGKEREIKELAKKKKRNYISFVESNQELQQKPNNILYDTSNVLFSLHFRLNESRLLLWYT